MSSKHWRGQVAGCLSLFVAIFCYYLFAFVGCWLFVIQQSTCSSVPLQQLCVQRGQVAGCLFVTGCLECFVTLQLFVTLQCASAVVVCPALERPGSWLCH